MSIPKLVDKKDKRVGGKSGVTGAVEGKLSVVCGRPVKKVFQRGRKDHLSGAADRSS